jgi:PhoD-like phosphatase
MPPRPGVNRIELGPIVGHTDHQSTRIWIKVFDDPGFYTLRVIGVGTFDFVSTEVLGPLEFRTAVAVASGLRADLRYRYNILRLGRILPDAAGSVRTLPDPSSMAITTFCAISCNVAESDGAWKALGKFVEDAKPQFILMMGDQLYLDEDGLDMFKDHLNSTAKVRRKAIVEKYRINWSRPVVRKVFANVPIYMMWDDHDIRDGWGSGASDSETLVARHARGRTIFDKCQAYYQDCRDIYWHFQGCHNPRASDAVDPALPNYIDGPPPTPARYAMPYAFRCGRLVVLMLDSRGERDVFRETLPILGETQWKFIDHVFENLAPDVEALVVMTPTPIASLDPDGQTLKLMGDRTDDVEAFRIGDEKNTLFPEPGGNAQVVPAILNVHLSPVSEFLGGGQLNLGSFKIGNIDEARDQWSHKFSRPEQERLLRSAGKARVTQRTEGSARGLLFVSGDIHVGARFTITCSKPPYEALSLTASGISTIFEHQPIVHALLDTDFTVAPGIQSSLLEVVTEVNFGIVHIIPTGRGAEIQGVVAHAGNSLTLGLDINLFL